METAHVKYLGGLRTEATHLKSGNKLITDAPTDNHGKGEAFSPTDLMATSLASCILTVMGIMADRKEIPFEAAEAKVTKIMGSNPRRIEEVVIEITIPDQNYTDEQKKLLEAAGRACPVGKSVHPDMKETISFNYL